MRLARNEHALAFLETAAYTGNLVGRSIWTYFHDICSSAQGERGAQSRTQLNHLQRHQGIDPYHVKDTGAFSVPGRWYGFSIPSSWCMVHEAQGESVNLCHATTRPFREHGLRRTTTANLRSRSKNGPNGPSAHLPILPIINLMSVESFGSGLVPRRFKLFPAGVYRNPP